VRFRVVDIETTGTKAPDHDAGIIELAYRDVVSDDTGWTIYGWGRSFVQCNIPVDIEARAVHHITDAEIASGIPLDYALTLLVAPIPDRPKADYFVAHNASFEQDFLPVSDTPWICTYKCALRLWPDAPKHSNQALRYYLDLKLDLDLAMPPHRALPDCYVTAHLLVEILRETERRGFTVADLLKISSLPPMPKYIAFGKHKGDEWAKVPASYLDWIINKSDFDADVKWLATHWITRSELREGISP
jgi:exodeoxyribonuclease X